MHGLYHVPNEFSRGYEAWASRAWHKMLRPVQIQGRGNGIKTEVVNNVEIAKALDRLPECEPLLLPALGLIEAGQFISLPSSA